MGFDTSAWTPGSSWSADSRPPDLFYTGDEDRQRATKEAGWRLAGRLSSPGFGGIFWSALKSQGETFVGITGGRIAGRQFSGQGRAEKTKQRFAEDVQFVLTPGGLRKEIQTQQKKCLSNLDLIHHV